MHMTVCFVAEEWSVTCNVCVFVVITVESVLNQTIPCDVKLCALNDILIAELPDNYDALFLSVLLGSCNQKLTGNCPLVVIA